MSKLVATIGIYGNREIGFAFLADVAGGIEVFGNYKPGAPKLANEDATTALFAACDALKARGVDKGQAMVCFDRKANGRTIVRSGTIEVASPPWFGNIAWTGNGGRVTILTREDGTPIERPRREDFGQPGLEGDLAFLSAFNTYKDTVAGVANAAFADGFKESDAPPMKEGHPDHCSLCRARFEDRARRFDVGERICVMYDKPCDDTIGGYCIECDVAEARSERKRRRER